MKTLEQSCTPRRSVFDQRGKDTVYNIDDLRKIPPAEFFAENYITDGMRLLLEEAFKRLDGKPGVGLSEKQIADFIKSCRPAEPG